jgi:hypothetical protein
LVEYALSEQCPKLNIMKRERWTKADVDALPAEKPDVFERKSAELFARQSEFLDAVAKVLSAFANSGGGPLILDVNDDGMTAHRMAFRHSSAERRCAIGSSKRYLNCSITHCQISGFIQPSRATRRASFTTAK